MVGNIKEFLLLLLFQWAGHTVLIRGTAWWQYQTIGDSHKVFFSVIYFFPSHLTKTTAVRKWASSLLMSSENMFTSPQFRSCCFGGFLRILLLHQQCLKDKICPPRLLVKQAVATNIWFTDSPVKNRSRFHWSFHSTPHGVSHHPSIWLPQLLISELAEISGELIQQLIILIEVQISANF